MGKSQTRLSVAVIVFTIAMALTASSTDKPKTWEFVVESAGHRYVMDYNLTLQDCVDRMYNYEKTACELSKEHKK